MSTLHLSYLRAFRIFADKQLNQRTAFTQIGGYAVSLTQYANQLLNRAARNQLEDLPQLQKDLFKAGCEYIQKFTFKFRKIQSANLENEEYFPGQASNNLFLIFSACEFFTSWLK